ncbi:hypothetical protein F4777DRAFT_564930 [Nemania sp. FL0916]|nr:hypothetical protein F4777DRAFT_564930 [Nemania sp. FL0916]
MAQDASKIVFRLRGLPANLATLDNVANIIHIGFFDLPGPRARVFSLSTSLHQYETTRVATVMFDILPLVIQKNPSANQWEASIRSGADSYHLVLDTHFLGMTPLNHIEPLRHIYDCIAISGLASHPFGSWQPRASDKTYMWIRDALPKRLGGIKTIIYGYDTKLDESRSFQNIPDLARELINCLQTYGCNLQPAKPIVFLAHSLGGLVLKEALVQLYYYSNKDYESLLYLVRGVVFFGVPNLDMEQFYYSLYIKRY